MVIVKNKSIETLFSKNLEKKDFRSMFSSIIDVSFQFLSSTGV
jgi:hypothetical protein